MFSLEVFNQWGEQWAAFMGVRILESSILLAIVGLTWLVLRRWSSVHLGYWLFLLVLLKLLIPGPVAVGGILKIDKLPSFVGQSPLPAQPSEPESGSEVGPPLPGKKAVSPPAPSAIPKKVSSSISLLALLMFVWAGIAGLFLLRFLYSQWRTHRLVQRAAPVELGKISESFSRIKTEAGIQRSIRIVGCETMTSPVVWGVFRPVIIVPPDLFKHYSSAHLRWIFFHELAHIRRHDNMTILLQRLAQIFFFFHPAVWLTNRLLDQQREFICDDLAVESSQIPPQSCGEAFLNIVSQEYLMPGFLEVSTGIGSAKRYMRKRLSRILSAKSNCAKRISKPGKALLTGFTFLALAFSSASQGPVAASFKYSSPPLLSDAAIEFSQTGEQITIHLAGTPPAAKELEMVLIQPGTFLMGSPADERGRQPGKEWPQHRVTITKPFYMGQYEVTQAQWEAVMGRNPSYFKGKPNNPVEKVRWEQCRRFIRRLNALGLGTFRLPTEAEWEYACRAGTTTRFSFGDGMECSDTSARYCEIADKYMWWSGNNDPNGTKEVGLKKPNPWGLFDMHGNVHEWCFDRWQKPYQRSDQVDPQGPLSGSKFLIFWTNRVFKGGCWRHGHARDCRSAARSYEQSSDYYYGLGLRLVREYE